MLIIAEADAPQQDIERISEILRAHDLQPSIARTRAKTVVAVANERGGARLRELITEDQLLALPSVTEVLYPSTPYVLSSREYRDDDTIVDLGDGVRFGHNEAPVIIAGPCSIESEEQVREVARSVKDSGATVLRGGLFKPRTSPFSFQGLGESGFSMMRDVLDETGLKFVTEAMDERGLEFAVEHADMIQVGSRNMHNSALLKKVGETRTPVLLKRGFSATIDELLQAADYILAGGNEKVVLCERGIRTFNTHSRNTLDLSVIPAIRERSHLPVIVDPSHGTGVSSLVTPMSLAAIACGAAGLIVEVHNEPKEALSDGKQALDLQEFQGLMNALTGIAEATGRGFAIKRS